MKRILLCNDDGYLAAGINALDAIFSEIAEVWLLAPAEERSGCSHALNFYGDLFLKEISPRHYKLENAYPADCVNVALHTSPFPKFDLIISGINHGANLGYDVHYSGTVACARQASIHGVPAVAMSSFFPRASSHQFLKMAQWLALWLNEYFKEFQPHVVYNINYPLIDEGDEIKEILFMDEHKNIDASSVETFFTNQKLESYKNYFPEHRFCYQGKRSYKDHYHELEPLKNQKGRRLKLESAPIVHELEKSSDVETVLNKMIAITPLSTYTTDAREYQRCLEKEKLRKNKVN